MAEAKPPESLSCHAVILKFTPFFQLMTLLNNRIKAFIYLFLILLAAGCNGDQKQETDNSFHIPEQLDRRAQLRFEQYAVQGRLLYKQHCANCHQDDGSGLGKLIPPLAKSDYLRQNPQKAVCIIRYGMEGHVVVNGIDYNQPMPANRQLKDIEIAEIATYILNAWGNREGFVSVQQAQEWLKDCELPE